MLEIKLKNQDARIIEAALIVLMQNNNKAADLLPVVPEMDSVRDSIKKYNADIQALHSAICDLMIED